MVISSVQTGSATFHPSSSLTTRQRIAHLLLRRPSIQTNYLSTLTNNGMAQMLESLEKDQYTALYRDSCALHMYHDAMSRRLKLNSLDSI